VADGLSRARGTRRAFHEAPRGTACAHPEIEAGHVGSVIKKRRKRMAKKKHRKLLRKTRHQRRNKK